jgi:hypothetical protein
MYLKRALPTFVDQKESEVIVVDYDLPRRNEGWVAETLPHRTRRENSGSPDLQCEPRPQRRRRDRACPMARICDADNLLPPSFASELLARLVPGTYLRDPSEHAVWSDQATDPPWHAMAATFWRVGGYDDAFRGWGPEDREFIDRLDRSGIKGSARCGGSRRDATAQQCGAEHLLRTHDRRKRGHQSSLCDDQATILRKPAVDGSPTPSVIRPIGWWSKRF